jgi:hypothetical protein
LIFNTLQVGKNLFKKSDNIKPPAGNKQNFGFRKHFLTGSERREEKLLEAASRVSGSEPIYRIRRTGDDGF